MFGQGGRTIHLRRSLLGQLITRWSVVHGDGATGDPGGSCVRLLCHSARLMSIEPNTVITFKTGTYLGVSVVDFRTLTDNVKHRAFERLFIFAETVLLPGVVEDSSIKIVTLHTLIKEADTSTVVGLLFELELPAVLHEMAELVGIAAAQLL